MAIESYLEREQAKRKQGMTPTLQAPAPLTTAGQTYQQRVTEGLTKPSPVTQQAQATADTNIARRSYLTRKQAQEDVAQTPFAAGSKQATRIMDVARAGSNLANLQEQQQVGNIARAENQQTMERARGVESDAYTKALGERTAGQVERSRYSSLIADPKARYAYNRMVSQGMSPDQAYQSIVGQEGSIQEQFRGLTPVGTVQEDARQWVSAVTDLQDGTPEFETAVRERMIAIDEAQQKPLSDATTERQKQNIEEKLRAGETLSQEEKDIATRSGVFSEMTFETVPVGSGNVQRFLESNPSGNINIGGENYKIVRGGRETTSYKAAGAKWSPRHTDWVEVETPEGETKYIWDGKLNDSTPSKASTPGENIKRKANPLNWL